MYYSERKHKNNTNISPVKILHQKNSSIQFLVIAEGGVMLNGAVKKLAL